MHNKHMVSNKTILRHNKLGILHLDSTEMLHIIYFEGEVNLLWSVSCFNVESPPTNSWNASTFTGAVLMPYGFLHQSVIHKTTSSRSPSHMAPQFKANSSVIILTALEAGKFAQTVVVWTAADLTEWHGGFPLPSVAVEDAVGAAAVLIAFDVAYWGHWMWQDQFVLIPSSSQSSHPPLAAGLCPSPLQSLAGW